MDSQVRAIPLAMLDQKFEADHAKGRGRNEHGFNWHAEDVIKHYEAVWDRCEAKKAQKVAP